MEQREVCQGREEYRQSAHSCNDGQMDPYSVLMSVYCKENPDYLWAAMESIYAQTVPANDFVLVCDGPLNPDLDHVIELMQNTFGDVLHVVRLKENSGLGKALNIGIQHCKNNLVARMDSDDISFPNRCEKQLAVFKKKPKISIVGGFVDEFSKTPEQVESRRVVPETHAKIVKFAKARNPFNHPTVMFRKEDVLAAGNYPPLIYRYMEDYYLWIEMLLRDFQGYNIQEPLVWMRVDSNLFKRRSGKQYAKMQRDFLKHMRDVRFITYPQYLVSAIVRTGSAYAPNCVRKFAFKTLLRTR